MKNKKNDIKKEAQMSLFFYVVVYD